MTMKEELIAKYRDEYVRYTSADLFTREKDELGEKCCQILKEGKQHKIMSEMLAAEFVINARSYGKDVVTKLADALLDTQQNSVPVSKFFSEGGDPISREAYLLEDIIGLLRKVAEEVSER